MNTLRCLSVKAKKCIAKYLINFINCYIHQQYISWYQPPVLAKAVQGLTLGDNRCKLQTK